MVDCTSLLIEKAATIVMACKFIFWVCLFALSPTLRLCNLFKVRHTIGCISRDLNVDSAPSYCNSSRKSVIPTGNQTRDYLFMNRLPYPLDQGGCYIFYNIFLSKIHSVIFRNAIAKKDWISFSRKKVLFSCQLILLIKALSEIWIDFCCCAECRQTSKIQWCLILHPTPRL